MTFPAVAHQGDRQENQTDQQGQQDHDIVFERVRQQGKQGKKPPEIPVRAGVRINQGRIGWMIKLGRTDQPGQ